LPSRYAALRAPPSPNVTSHCTRSYGTTGTVR
jgi:hypothetical protein